MELEVHIARVATYRKEARDAAGVEHAARAARREADEKFTEAEADLRKELSARIKNLDPEAPEL